MTQIIKESYILLRALVHYVIFDKILDAIILGSGGWVLVNIVDIVKSMLPNWLQHQIAKQAINFSDFLNKQYQVIKSFVPDIFSEENKHANNNLDWLEYCKNTLHEFLLPISIKTLMFGTLQAISLYSARFFLPGKAAKIAIIMYDLAEAMPEFVVNSSKNLINSASKKIAIHSLHASEKLNILVDLIGLDFTENSYVGKAYKLFFTKYHGPTELFYHLVLMVKPVADYISNGLEFEQTCNCTAIQHDRNLFEDDLAIN